MLPIGNNGERREWNEATVRELTRLEDKRDAAKVAAKVIKAVEQSEREAVQDPEVRPLKVTAATVRKFVDKELGVNRPDQAKETKRRREEESKPELHRYLLDTIGSIKVWTKLLREEVEPEDWELLCKRHPGLVVQLRDACETLADVLPVVRPAGQPAGVLRAAQSYGDALRKRDEAQTKGDDWQAFDQAAAGALWRLQQAACEYIGCQPMG
jgi:hypothetical protein